MRVCARSCKICDSVATRQTSEKNALCDKVGLIENNLVCFRSHTVHVVWRYSHRRPALCFLFVEPTLLHATWRVVDVQSNSIPGILNGIFSTNLPFYTSVILTKNFVEIQLHQSCQAILIKFAMLFWLCAVADERRILELTFVSRFEM